MRIKILGLFICMIFVLIIGDLHAFAGDLDRFVGVKGTIRIAGGTAHIPVMKEAAKRIMKMNPHIKISIAGGGSGVGIKQVGEGLVDIGNTGRKATDDEIQRYGLVMIKFAIDGIAIVVNPQNPVSRMSKNQVRNIFSGVVRNWKELGGEAREINVYTRDASSGTRKVFWKKALDKGDITKAANFVKSNGAMKTAIGVDPYGIGYVSVGYVDEMIKPVIIDGIEPSLENVRKGEYSVARGLYMNIKGEPTGLTKLFMEYILSQEGQHIVEEKGFIAVK
ncbi:MAG: phosphate ABC transporter substrate-binding protein [Thermodesulfobacteriota bacterium]|nr:phosphate ABC transporter substrate-binding protein [Thermodesulfobacteriota bacterium]